MINKGMNGAGDVARMRTHTHTYIWNLRNAYKFAIRKHEKK